MGCAQCSQRPHWLAYPFEGVALLPFVDERRLRAALEEVYPDLTPEEGEFGDVTQTHSLSLTQTEGVPLSAHLAWEVGCNI